MRKLFHATICLLLLSTVACKKKTVKPVPVIDSFQPVSVTANEPVKIIGSGFTGTTLVSFGNMPATSFRVVSDSVIMAVVSSGASGSITVTNDGGTASKPGFEYYVAQWYTLTGVSTYKIYGYPPTDPNPYYNTSLQDTCRVLILKSNPYDSSRNTHEDYPPFYSILASDPAYTRLVGVGWDTKTAVVNSVVHNFLTFKGGSGVAYARFTGQQFEIPPQTPIFYSNTIFSGSGSLINGKLQLYFKSNYRGTIKEANLVSE
ncbi:MAG: IPT/TIG domain-containing protein [Sediminibacterium sp.]|nr:IPT/TIG domain-containing protein [Sediminibacterium sp.]